MNRQVDSDYFDDSKLQEQFKQTATFFNPNQSAQKLINSSKGQGRPAMEYTFKPSQPRIIQNEVQQSLMRRNSGKQHPQYQKITSPVKTIKQGMPKPFSPPIDSKYHEQIKRIKETDIREELNHYQEQLSKPVAKNFNGSRVLRLKEEGPSKTADAPVRVQFHTKQSERPQESVRLSSDQNDLPSYKRSLLESDRFKTNLNQNLNDLLKKSNSTAFLPQIQPKLQSINAIPYGYGSVSQQETAPRTNSSKQTITNNEFLNAHPDDSLMRKSKTAQETMRESGAQQIQNKLTFKLNSAESQGILPQIHSPNQGTQQGFSQSKGRSFLQRKPQAKIISRLFSSKSDNKNN